MNLARLLVWVFNVLPFIWPINFSKNSKKKKKKSRHKDHTNDWSIEMILKYDPSPKVFEHLIKSLTQFLICKIDSKYTGCFTQYTQFLIFKIDSI